MTIRIFFTALFLLIAMPAWSADKIYNAQHATLDNGLEIVVIPVHRTPAVTHMIWYKTGSGEELAGVSGVAHFLEHLMFKGTPNVPVGKFTETIQRMGGNDNAFTSYDYTAYHQTVPVKRLGDVMRMEAERMNDLTPKLNDVLAERNVVIEERRQTTDGDPGTMLIERMRNVLFPNHAYGKPVLGWMSEMQKLKWIDVLAFYKKWYAPNNAIVVISGDVTMQEVLPLAQSTYGQLKREVVPARIRTLSPKLEGEVLVRFQRGDVRQPMWERMIRVPSARQNPKDSLSLFMLADLLGGATGRLYQQLVVKDKIATTVDVSYGGYALDDATFILYAAPADGVSMEKLAAAVDKVLAQMVSEGFTSQEVKASVARLQDAVVYALDSLSGPAMGVGYALATGISLDDVETWPSRIETVTPDMARDALKTYVLGQKGVTGWLLPEAAKDGMQ